MATFCFFGSLDGNANVRSVNPVQTDSLEQRCQPNQKSNDVVVIIIYSMAPVVIYGTVNISSTKLSPKFKVPVLVRWPFSSLKGVLRRSVFVCSRSWSWHDCTDVERLWPSNLTASPGGRTFSTLFSRRPLQ